MKENKTLIDQTQVVKEDYGNYKKWFNQILDSYNN